MVQAALSLVAIGETSLGVSLKDFLLSGTRKILKLSRMMLQLLRAYALISLASFRNVAPRHHLPGELLVSLTSVSGRFGILAFTLRALLDQSIKPDRTILWISEAEYSLLPKEVIKLRNRGLEIMTCEDFGPHTKIIPTILLAPASFIVTADDDVYYERDWLRTLVDGFDPQNPTIVCRRAHKPRRDSRGRLLPYDDWEWEIEMDVNAPPCDDLFPTGIGGVLYFPGSLAYEVTNREALRTLCPRADDVWLYWMSRMAGTGYRQVGGSFKQIPWPTSQRVSLYSVNVVGGQNDVQICAMEDNYGLY